MKYFVIFIISVYSFAAFADCVSLGSPTYVCKSGYYMTADRKCAQCPLIGYNEISKQDAYGFTDNYNTDGKTQCRIPSSGNYSDTTGSFQVVMPPDSGCFWAE